MVCKSGKSLPVEAAPAAKLARHARLARFKMRAISRGSCSPNRPREAGDLVRKAGAPTSYPPTIKRSFPCVYPWSSMTSPRPFSRVVSQRRPATHSLAHGQFRRIRMGLEGDWKRLTLSPGMTGLVFAIIRRTPRGWAFTSFSAGPTPHHHLKDRPRGTRGIFANCTLFKGHSE